VCHPRAGYRSVRRATSSPVYLTGEFLKSALTFGAGHTAASTLWGLVAEEHLPPRLGGLTHDDPRHLRYRGPDADGQPARHAAAAVPAQPLLQRWSSSSENERIYFDVEKIRPRIAPFVAPHLPGKIVEEIGYDTQDFKPAYVKPKTVSSPKGALKRQMGEALTGALSPAERQLIRLNRAIEGSRADAQSARGGDGRPSAAHRQGDGRGDGFPTVSSTSSATRR
jgi:hypothetical protein